MWRARRPQKSFFQSWEGLRTESSRPSYMVQQLVPKGTRKLITVLGPVFCSGHDVQFSRVPNWRVHIFGAMVGGFSWTNRRYHLVNHTPIMTNGGGGSIKPNIEQRPPIHVGLTHKSCLYIVHMDLFELIRLWNHTTSKVMIACSFVCLDLLWTLPRFV